jgi:hypothetical protein
MLDWGLFSLIPILPRKEHHMRKQNNFQRIFTQLRSFNLHLRYLRLTLNHSSVPVHEKIETLLQTHQKLQLLQNHLYTTAEVVMLRFGQYCDRPDSSNYSALASLIKQLQRLICSLLHLTEEYFIDPIGVQACLENSIDADLLSLQSYLDHLQTVIIQMDAGSGV